MKWGTMKTQHIDLHGETFACRVIGQGAPLLMVHGNLSDLRSWEPLQPVLSHHFCTISYSRRYAHPNPPISAGEDDPMARHVDDLIALIERLRLGRVHLVGNSSGAFICLLAAEKRPDLVRSLTLEEPPVVSLFLRQLPPTAGEVLKLLMSAPWALGALLKLGIGTILPATRAFQAGDDIAGLNIFARGVLGDDAYTQVAPLRRQQMAENLMPHRAALLGSGLPVFTEANAAAIQVPTQLLHGKETPTFQQHINRRLAGLIPGARAVCIADASHLVHEDNPLDVAQALVDFCIHR